MLGGGAHESFDELVQVEMRDLVDDPKVRSCTEQMDGCKLSYPRSPTAPQQQLVSSGSTERKLTNVVKEVAGASCPNRKSASAPSRPRCETGCVPRSMAM